MYNLQKLELICLVKFKLEIKQSILSKLKKLANEVVLEGLSD